MNKFLRLKIFLRSLLIQAGWNYERMQNVGFAFAICPALQAAYRREELGRELVRHLQMFNTQPFMASFILGLTARLEQEAAAAPAEKQAELKARIMAAKTALASAAAAIGDSLFWGVLKHLSLLITIYISLLLGVNAWMLPLKFRTMPVSDHELNVMIFSIFSGVVFYNMLSVWIRWKGLSYSYKCGINRNCGIDFIDWQKLIKRLKLAGFVLALMVAILAVYSFTRGILAYNAAEKPWLYIVTAAFAFLAACISRRMGYFNMHLYLVLVVLFSGLSFFV